MHTHYDNLRVTRNATAGVIKAAYRALSHEFHPDKNPGRDTTRIMEIINEAYAVLSDPAARARYDATLLNDEGKSSGKKQGAASGKPDAKAAEAKRKRAAEAAVRERRAREATKNQREAEPVARSGRVAGKVAKTVWGSMAALAILAVATEYGTTPRSDPITLVRAVQHQAVRPVASAAPANPNPSLGQSSDVEDGSWTNPISGLPSDLDDRWREYPSLEGQRYAWVFKSASGEVAAINVGPVSDRELADGPDSRSYLPVVRFDKVTVGGRTVWEGAGAGAVHTDNANSGGLPGLSGYLKASREKFARAWIFEGSGSRWEVLYLSNVADSDAERNAQGFFESILVSTRGDEPPIGAKSNDPMVWINPVTGRSVQFSGLWEVNPLLLSKVNPWAYTSACHLVEDTCTSGHEAVGIRFIPDAEKNAPATYLDALRSVNDPTYQLLGTSTETVEGGRQVIAGRGPVDVHLSPGPDVRYWIFRANGGVWRVVYTAESGYDNENNAYRFFKEVLGTTLDS
jgi:DnaJ domain